MGRYTPDQRSWLNTLLMLSLSGFALYLVAGVAFRYKTLGLRGEFPTLSPIVARPCPALWRTTAPVQSGLFVRALRGSGLGGLGAGMDTIPHLDFWRSIPQRAKRAWHSATHGRFSNSDIYSRYGYGPGAAPSATEARAFADATRLSWRRCRRSQVKGHCQRRPQGHG